MAMRTKKLELTFSHLLIIVIALLSCIRPTQASLGRALIPRASNSEQTSGLDPNRQPALYTENFGDCLGGSLLDITRFDAAYYKDNMTVVFHLQGSSLVTGVPLLMQIGVFAYGESRFNLLFNPCNANLYSLCPTNISVPVEASGLIPVSDADVAGIPPIALGIPDFEGQAILRIFSNATESEIACYSAVVTNGNSFSHPSVIGPIVGMFVFAALVASFLSATYGDDVATIRTHYAHSMSVFVVFSVLQHIYFTGALSVNWPSVLPAFWSNFAWASGMVYSEKMMNSVNKLLGVNLGNTSIVGAAALGNSDNTGGGYQLNQIYKRSLGLSAHVFGRAPITYSELIDRSAFEQHTARHLAKRAIENSTTGYDWYGTPVNLGLPLPGNYSGFAGTLSQEGIPASNAFLTGFLWFLIILAIVVACVIAVKWVAELFVRIGWAKQDLLALFRRHWIGFAALVAARTFFIAFFMMMFLSIFQFVYKGSNGVYAVAACVFIIFFLGLLGIAALACLYRIRVGQYSTVPNRIHLERTNASGKIPWYGFRREHLREKENASPSIFSIPWWRFEDANVPRQRDTVHEDTAYVKRYGWLSARFRRTRWWFFAAWLTYELVRACFYGGAASHAKIQVYGLLVVEIIAFCVLVKMKPFEGNRQNVLMVYLLGFSKIASVALSAVFIADYGKPRIMATAIGIVMIVIQAILLLVMIVLIVLGAMSTRMSMTRNREVESHSEDWATLRERWFEHLNRTAPGCEMPKPIPRPAAPTQQQSTSSRFSVHTIQRIPKIEDYEDPDAIDFAPNDSHTSIAEGIAEGSNIHHNTVSASRRFSRANSMHSTMSHSNLPFGARPHRASWSSRDFHSFHESQSQRGSIYVSPNVSRSNLHNMRSDTSLRDGYQVQPRNRAPSRPSSARPQSGPLEVRRSRTSTMVGTGMELRPIPSAKEEDPSAKVKEDEIGTAL